MLEKFGKCYKFEISGICEKFHFFEWKFQWTPRSSPADQTTRCGSSTLRPEQSCIRWKGTRAWSTSHPRWAPREPTRWPSARTQRRGFGTSPPGRSCSVRWGVDMKIQSPGGIENLKIKSAFSLPNFSNFPTLSTFFCIFFENTRTSSSYLKFPTIPTKFIIYNFVTIFSTFIRL